MRGQTMGISPTLNIPQARFLAMQHKFKAYVAGFGSGKTWVGCGGICKGMWEHPKINQGYFAPTYPQIRDIFYPTIEEVAFDWGLSVKINEGICYRRKSLSMTPIRTISMRRTSQQVTQQLIRNRSENEFFTSIVKAAKFRAKVSNLYSIAQCRYRER